MPIGDELTGAANVGRGPFTGSSKGAFRTVYDDAETASTSGDEIDPDAIDNAEFHWLPLEGSFTRVLIRARYTASATVTTSPVVAIIGRTNEGYIRLDSPTDANGTGVTLTLVSSGTGLMKADVGGTEMAYSDFPNANGYDCLGCNAVGVVVQTAANVSTGTVPIQLCPLN